MTATHVLPIGHSFIDIKFTMLHIYNNIFRAFILKNNNFGPQNWGGPAL